MELDFFLIASGILAQGVLLALLAVKHIGRAFSAFRLYLLSELLYGVLYLCIPATLGEVRFSAWIAATIIDTLLYLAVLIELGRNTLRHNGISPPSRWFLFVMFLGVALVVWPAVQASVSLNLPPLWILILRVLQFTTLIQAAALGTLVSWSSFSKLRWPSHEFRVATGIAACTIVSLGVLMLHNDGFNGLKNHWVDQFNPAAALLATLWWIQHFWFIPKNSIQAEVSEVFEMASSGPANRDISQVTG